MEKITTLIEGKDFVIIFETLCEGEKIVIKRKIESLNPDGFRNERIMRVYERHPISTMEVPLKLIHDSFVYSKDNKLLCLLSQIQ